MKILNIFINFSDFIDISLLKRRNMEQDQIEPPLNFYNPSPPSHTPEKTTFKKPSLIRVKYYYCWCLWKFKDLKDYNQKKKRKLLIVFDDVIADMKAN